MFKVAAGNRLCEDPRHGDHKRRLQCQASTETDALPTPVCPWKRSLMAPRCPAQAIPAVWLEAVEAPPGNRPRLSSGTLPAVSAVACLGLACLACLARVPGGPRSPCENFLYVFKAARRAARAAASARTPSLALALPLRRRQRRAAGAKSTKPGRVKYSKFHRCRQDVPAPAAGIVRGRSEPVKAVCGRRATTPVELPGERTREDDLDRTCPDLELAAIGNRDTSGQGPDA